jgi:hypothetical protein
MDVSVITTAEPTPEPAVDPSFAAGAATVIAANAAATAEVAAEAAVEAEAAAEISAASAERAHELAADADMSAAAAHARIDDVVGMVEDFREDVLSILNAVAAEVITSEGGDLPPLDEPTAEHHGTSESDKGDGDESSSSKPRKSPADRWFGGR